MNDAKSNLEDRIGALEDDQLISMLTIDAGQYRPETLALAEAEALKRELVKGKPATAHPPPDPGAAARSAVEAARAAMGPGRFSAGGKAITCGHCGEGLFDEQRVLLNTRMRTFFNFDWLDPAATVLVCTNCSRIQWFAKAPERF